MVMQLAVDASKQKEFERRFIDYRHEQITTSVRLVLKKTLLHLDRRNKLLHDKFCPRPDACFCDVIDGCNKVATHVCGAEQTAVQFITGANVFVLKSCNNSPSASEALPGTSQGRPKTHRTCEGHSLLLKALLKTFGKGGYELLDNAPEGPLENSTKKQHDRNCKQFLKLMPPELWAGIIDHQMVRVIFSSIYLFLSLTFSMVLFRINEHRHFLYYLVAWQHCKCSVYRSTIIRNSN